MQGGRGDTDAYFEAVRKGDIERLGRELQANPSLLGACGSPSGAPCNDSGPGGFTGLHVAVQAGQVEAARLLLDAGIDIEARTSEGRSALHDAVELSRMEISALLMERGARIDVCLAAILGRMQLLRELLEADPALANDRSTQLSPLGWAAYGNRPDTAAELLDRGARMDDGELLCAASVGHVEVSRLLIERGADPEQAGPDGANALHVGVAMRYTQSGVPFVRMLLEHGVDTSLRTEQGETALELARRFEHAQAERVAAGTEDCPRPYDQVIALLEQHG